ncbi:MAG: GAF domain-containing protein [Candidatus Lindowbacteria bacterium]|nr:GAF domain-containing protein [Candidatus Lindowbacteria bacterium]
MPSSWTSKITNKKLDRFSDSITSRRNTDNNVLQGTEKFGIPGFGKIALVAGLSLMFILFEGIAPFLAAAAVTAIVVFRKYDILGALEVVPGAVMSLFNSGEEERKTFSNTEYAGSTSMIQTNSVIQNVVTRVRDMTHLSKFFGSSDDEYEDYDEETDELDRSDREFKTSVPDVKASRKLADVIPLNNHFAPAWKDIDDFLQASLDVIKTRFDFQTANIFLKGYEEDVLIQRAYVTRTQSIARLAVIKVGHGLVGWVAKNKRPLLVSNLKHEGRSLGYYKTRGENISSFAAAPILIDDVVVGVIALDHDKPDVFSSPETEDALSAMAALLARVLGAEETMEQGERELERLRESRRIFQVAYTARDLDSAAKAVVNELVTLTDFHSISCYLLDETGEPSRRAEIGFNGIGAFHYKEPVMQRAVQQALSQGFPFYVEGSALSAQYRAVKAPHTVTPEILAAYPILYKGASLGAVVIELNEKMGLDERLEGILNDMVDNLGGGLMRVYQAHTAEGNAKSEGDLVRFTTGLMESQNVTEVWNRLFDHLFEKTTATRAVVYRKSENEFILEKSEGCTPSMTIIPENTGLVGWAALSGKVVTAESGDRRKSPIEEGCSFLACPVKVENEVHSVVVLAADEHNAFSKEIIEWTSELFALVYPILKTSQRMEEAKTALEIDSLTGLFCENGLMKRIQCLNYTSEVGAILMRVDNLDELLGMYGRAEVNRFLRGIGVLLHPANFGDFNGSKWIAAKLDGARFIFSAMDSDDEGKDIFELKDQIVRKLLGTKIASIGTTSVSYSFSIARTLEGTRVEELLDAAEARLASETRETRVVNAA